MAVNQETKLDQSKKETFAGRMLGVLNDSFLGVMVSVGQNPPRALSPRRGHRKRRLRHRLPRLSLAELYQVTSRREEAAASYKTALHILSYLAENAAEREKSSILGSKLGRDLRQRV